MVNMKKYIKAFIHGLGITVGAAFMIGLGLGSFAFIIVGIFGESSKDPSNPWLIVLGVVMMGALVGIGAAIDEYTEAHAKPEDKDLTKHRCDICDTKMKKGEGYHFKDPGTDKDCYCVCLTCCPTVMSAEGKELAQ